MNGFYPLTFVPKLVKQLRLYNKGIHILQLHPLPHHEASERAHVRERLVKLPLYQPLDSGQSKMILVLLLIFFECQGTFALCNKSPVRLVRTLEWKEESFLRSFFPFPVLQTKKDVCASLILKCEPQKMLHEIKDSGAASSCKKKGHVCI